MSKYCCENSFDLADFLKGSWEPLQASTDHTLRTTDLEQSQEDHCGGSIEEGD